MTTPATVAAQSPVWETDVLGPDFSATTIELGPDPDGEGTVRAVLVRHEPADLPPTRAAVLYVPGYTDYFFHRHVAEHLAARGFRFYALDLRKCGRARGEGQTPHFASDLALYDAELDAALALVRAETAGPVVLMAHSTGGLIVPLWLDRLRRAGRRPADLGVVGLALNSPWFDLQGPPIYRSAGTAAIDAFGRLSPKTALPLPDVPTYGRTLHVSAGGEWDYNLAWKPLSGFPIRLGWLRAVRAGQAQLHRGLDVGAPSLVLRSLHTRFESAPKPPVDRSDSVLDVRQIARWSGCLGARTSVVPIDGALHDVFLSHEDARDRAFAELDSWLETLEGLPTTQTPDGSATSRRS